MKFILSFNRAMAAMADEYAIGRLGAFGPHIETAIDRHGIACTGEFQSPGYIRCIHRKLAFALAELTASADGDLFAICDADIGWFADPTPYLDAFVKPDGLYFQDEGDGTPNGGLMIGRNGPTVRALLAEILHAACAADITDQAAMHILLTTSQTSNLCDATNLLPKRLFASETNGGLCGDSLCYHANNTPSNSLATKRRALDKAARTASVTVVVAAHDEALPWVRELPWKTVVVATRERSDTTMVISNRGREAAAWLHYIVHTHPHFSEYTVFLQADADRHAPKWRERVAAADLAGFTYLGATHAGLRKEEHDKWAERFAAEWCGGIQPAQVTVSYGAQFIAHRKRLLGRSKDYYQTLLDKVVAEHETAPWAIERLWEVVI